MNIDNWIICSLTCSVWNLLFSVLVVNVEVVQAQNRKMFRGSKLETEKMSTWSFSMCLFLCLIFVFNCTMFLFFKNELERTITITLGYVNAKSLNVRMCMSMSRVTSMLNY